MGLILDRKGYGCYEWFCQDLGEIELLTCHNSIAWYCRCHARIYQGELNITVKGSIISEIHEGLLVLDKIFNKNKFSKNKNKNIS